MQCFDEIPLVPGLYIVEGDPGLLKGFTSYMLVKNAPSVVLDGGNSFDPFSLSYFCRRLGEDVMESIFVSRAFTVFQLETLIIRYLPLFLERRKSNVAMVLSFGNLFASYEVEESITAFLHDKLLHRLGESSKKFKIPIMITDRDNSKTVFDYRVSLRSKGDGLLFALNGKSYEMPFIPSNQGTLDFWGCING